MIAKVTGITKNPSKYGGYFYYLFFKDSNGKNRRTCLDPKMKNFKRWEVFVDLATTKQVFELDNLILKGEMIDADSNPVLIERKKDEVSTISPERQKPLVLDPAASQRAHLSPQRELF